jgi:biuret amidohydrolase
MTTLDSSLVPRHVTGTTPYAWPWNGVMDLDNTATLVVESIHAARYAPDETYTNAAVEVAHAMRAAGGTVIRVRTASPSHSMLTSATAELDVPTDHTVTSAGIDGFFGSSLEALLRTHAIERLIIVGRGLETCIHSTMRTANDMGFECLLVIDASRPLDPELAAASVSMIEMSGGIFGAVGKAAAVITALATNTGEEK